MAQPQPTIPAGALQPQFEESFRVNHRLYERTAVLNRLLTEFPDMEEGFARLKAADLQSEANLDPYIQEVKSNSTTYDKKIQPVDNTYTSRRQAILNQYNNKAPLPDTNLLNRTYLKNAYPFLPVNSLYEIYQNNNQNLILTIEKIQSTMQFVPDGVNINGIKYPVATDIPQPQPISLSEFAKPSTHRFLEEVTIVEENAWAELKRLQTLFITRASQI